MDWFLCWVLGILSCLLVVIPIYYFRPHWTDESVADFSWAIVMSVMEQDNDMMLKLIEAHKAADDGVFKELEPMIRERIQEFENENN